MKNLFIRTLTIIVLISSLNNFCFTQISWIGGNGDWEVASNWSTGNIPGINDDVVIDVAGEIRVDISNGNHVIKSLFIGERDSLVIAIDQSLSVENADEYGIQIINGGLINHGELNVDGAEDIGIYVLSSNNLYGELENFGVVNINGSGGNGIHCSGIFANNGELNSNFNDGDGIELWGFIAPLHGTIKCNSNNVGIDIRPTAVMSNYGEIVCTNNSTGMRILGEIYNFNPGTIDIDASVNFGITMNDSELRNYNHIKVDGANVYGIVVANGGKVLNSKDIIVHNCLFGLATENSSNQMDYNEIKNYANLEIKSSNIGLILGEQSGGFDSLLNTGTIAISDCSYSGVLISRLSFFKNSSELIVDGCTMNGITITGSDSKFENYGSVLTRDCGGYGIKQTNTSLYHCKEFSRTEIFNCNAAWKLDFSSDLILDSGSVVKSDTITGADIFECIQASELDVPLGAELDLKGN